MYWRASEQQTPDEDREISSLVLSKSKQWHITHRQTLTEEAGNKYKKPLQRSVAGVCNGDMCGGYLACRAWMNSPTVCIWLTTKKPGSLSIHRSSHPCFAHKTSCIVFSKSSHKLHVIIESCFSESKRSSQRIGMSLPHQGHSK